MGDPGMLNRPFVASGTGGVRGLSEAEQLFHAGTAVLAPDGRLRPQLAVAIPTIENGGWRLFPDGRMETTWQLRPEARWHDGTPVTAGDLVFTAQIGNDKELSILRHPAFDSVESVVADDDRTVTVRWTRPFTEADRMFTAETLLPYPKHLAEATYVTNKGALFELSLWVNDYVGAGPFRLKEFVRNSHLTLSAFDGYVLGRPKLDEVVVRFIMDPNALIANLLAGEVEMTLGRGLSLEQGIQVGEQWRAGRSRTIRSCSRPILQRSATCDSGGP
jgi:peptide/nickel transport system substrate-binding protein